MRSGNPALSAKSFENLEAKGEQMTIQGTVNKSFILFALLLVGAIIPWNMAMNDPTNPNIMYMLFGGMIGGLIFALITIFKKTAAPYTAPLYALAEGVFLGAISAFFERQYGGIVIQAAMLTFGVLFCLLGAYKSGLIKVNKKFIMGVVAATGAIALVYLASMLMSLFGFGSFGFLHDSGPIGIGVSVVIVIVAALNLVLDFHFIKEASEQGAPKYMEWYGAFGLLVTLVWLYLEILRLLSKLRD